MRMTTNDDFLSEFDDPKTGEGSDADPVVEERAVLADPHLQESSIVNPATNLPEKAPDTQRKWKWHYIPMPVRTRAFYLWVEFGDYTSVAAKLGMTVEAVKALSERDHWWERSEELRAGLEKTLGVQVLENRRRALQLVHETLGELSPERIVALLDGKDIVRLLTTTLSDGGRMGSSGLNVHTGDGPVQVNLGSTRGEDRPLEKMTDEELAMEARAHGIDVQAAPRITEKDPEVIVDLPSPSEDSSGGQGSTSGQSDQLE